MLDQSADYWRARVAERADRVLVTSTWMVDRLAEFGVDGRPVAPRRRHRRLHPRPARPVAARLLVAGALGRAAPRSSSATSAGCTSATAYAASPSWPRCPASGLVVIGAGSQREWLEARLPGAG